jgi:hypothetical protein
MAFSVSNPPALKAKASLILAMVLRAFPVVGKTRQWDRGTGEKYVKAARF